MKAIKNYSKLSIIMLICATSILSCGGGGGGGGESSNSNSSIKGVRCEQNKPAVRVMHAGIDSSPINIMINGSLKSSRSYAKDYVYFSAGAGDRIALIERLSNQTLIDTGFDLNGSACKTLLFTGSKENNSLNVAILNDIAIDLSDGSSALRLINASSENSEYSLNVAGNTLTANDGSASNYFAITSGQYTFNIRNSSGISIASVTGVLNPKSHYSLIIRGQSGFVIESELNSDNL